MMREHRTGACWENESLYMCVIYVRREASEKWRSYTPDKCLLSSSPFKDGGQKKEWASGVSRSPKISFTNGCRVLYVSRGDENLSAFPDIQQSSPNGKAQETYSCCL